jgi:hypothetical protein
MVGPAVLHRLAEQTVRVRTMSVLGNPVRAQLAGRTAPPTGRPCARLDERWNPYRTNRLLNSRNRLIRRPEASRSPQHAGAGAARLLTAADMASAVTSAAAPVARQRPAPGDEPQIPALHHEVGCCPAEQETHNRCICCATLHRYPPLSTSRAACFALVHRKIG